MALARHGRRHLPLQLHLEVSHEDGGQLLLCQVEETSLLIQEALGCLFHRGCGQSSRTPGSLLAITWTFVVDPKMLWSPARPSSVSLELESSWSELVLGVFLLANFVALFRNRRLTSGRGSTPVSPRTEDSSFFPSTFRALFFFFFFFFFFFPSELELAFFFFPSSFPGDALPCGASPCLSCSFRRRCSSRRAANSSASSTTSRTSTKLPIQASRSAPNFLSLTTWRRSSDTGVPGHPGGHRWAQISFWGSPLATLRKASVSVPSTLDRR